MAKLFKNAGNVVKGCPKCGEFYIKRKIIDEQFGRDKTRPDKSTVYCNSCRHKKMPRLTNFDPGVKYCPGCDKDKPLSDFPLDPKRKKDGVGGYCKKCRKEQAAARREKLKPIVVVFSSMRNCWYPCLEDIPDGLEPAMVLYDGLWWKWEDLKAVDDGQVIPEAVAHKEYNLKKFQVISVDN